MVTNEGGGVTDAELATVFIGSGARNVISFLYLDQPGQWRAVWGVWAEGVRVEIQQVIFSLCILDHVARRKHIEETLPNHRMTTVVMVLKQMPKVRYAGVEQGKESQAPAGEARQREEENEEEEKFLREKLPHV